MAVKVGPTESRVELVVRPEIEDVGTQPFFSDVEEIYGIPCACSIFVK